MAENNELKEFVDKKNNVKIGVMQFKNPEAMADFIQEKLCYDYFQEFCLVF